MNYQNSLYYINLKCDQMKTNNLFSIFFLTMLSACLLLSTGCSKDDENQPTEFILPSVYIDAIGESGPSSFAEMPGGKIAKFYCLTQETFHALSELQTGTFDSEISFSGTTKAGGTKVSYNIPQVFTGLEVLPFVLIILDPSMNNADLEGLTMTQLLGMADGEEQLAIGFIGIEGEPQPYVVSDEGGRVELIVADLFVFLNSMI